MLNSAFPRIPNFSPDLLLADSIFFPSNPYSTTTQPTGAGDDKESKD